MSLILRAGETRVALSYGEFQDLRGELLRATILALNALNDVLDRSRQEPVLGNPASLESVLAELLLAFDAEPDTVEWMLAADRPAPQPNYDMLPLDVPAGGLPDVVLNALSGLNWFVNHSDCDGFHSAGQCEDIRAWLGLIARHVRHPWQERFRALQRLYGERRVVSYLG